MQNHHLWQAALVVGLCALTSPGFAQERSPDPQVVEQTASATHDQAQTEADQALAERIRQGLQENAPLSGVAQKIGITVANGEVTLQGEVKTAEERDGIESQVRQVQGVQDVQNRLRLAGADREAATRGPSERD
jgi:osmotically-inducible protein OsmY